MNEEDRIDFSALDRSRDQPRWERVVAAVSERASRRRRAASVPLQLRAWARPTLMAAAALALVVWAGAVVGRPRTPDTRDLAYQLQLWAEHDAVPAGAAILDVLGADHDAR